MYGVRFFSSVIASLFFNGIIPQIYTTMVGIILFSKNEQFFFFQKDVSTSNGSKLIRQVRNEALYH